MEFTFEDGFRARVLALPSRLDRGGRGADGGASRTAGGRLEFHEHRPYTDRDDSRDLDWNLYLRLDTLAVKTYSRSEVPDVFVLLDRSGSMGPEGSPKDRIVRELAVAIGYLALSQGSDLSLGFPGEGGPVVLGRFRSPRNLDAVLRLVSQLGPPTGPTRLGTLVHLPPPGPRGRAVYLLTDGLVEPFPVAALVALRRGLSRATLLSVITHAERDLDLTAPFVAVDPESGRNSAVGGGADLARAYREELERHERSLVALARQHHIEHRSVDDLRPFEDVVLGLLAGPRA